jgi:phage shock protein A
VSAKSEYDAAYFTLLRAREELDDLLRYADFLVAEQERLDGFVEQTQASFEDLPRKVRRPMDATAKPLLEAVGRRRAVVLDERRRLDQRMVNAEAFVRECEQEVETLRR